MGDPRTRSPLLFGDPPRRYAYTWVCNGVKAGERVGRRKATARICASPVHAYTYATYMRMYDTQMR